MKNRVYSNNPRKKSPKLPKIFLLIFMIMLFCFALKIYLGNTSKIDYKEYLGLKENEVITLFNGDYVELENKVIQQDNQIFLPVDFIKNYIDPYIFWDKNENKLTITNKKNVIRMKTKELEYFVNNKPLKLDIPIYNINDIAYIPYIFLKDFYTDFDFEYYPVENSLKSVLSICSKNFVQTVGELKKGTVIRLGGNKNEPYIAKYKDLQFDKKVTILEKNANEKGYIKVSTKDGYVGYVKERKIFNKETIEIEKSYEDEENEDGWKVENGKINLVFEQITNISAVQKSVFKTYPEGIDVLVPTFFSFSNTNGDIKNIADKTYVKKAHENGFKVWGLITDNFDENISHSILSSTETREYVIKQLLAYVSLYNLDGINIDFESVPSKDGEYFVQFLRELAPLLKEQGAVLSVDLFVPKPWTSHYMRKEVGKIADYVIVMGYDEHYAGSKKAGSVASISWSEEAITSTLKEGVPKEKLILGVPFYTRIWTEENVKGKIKLSSKASNMENAYKFIKEKGGEFVWLEDMGQYYGEVSEGNITYKVWLEDENSIEKRLELILKYDIAGCGAWKLWLEKEEVWEVLNNKLKTKN